MYQFIGNYTEVKPRWVCNHCSTYSSVTSIIESMNWATLRECRKIARSLFHDTVCDQI